MSASPALPVFLLAATLLLPPPGTVGREREFCSEWLRLSGPQRDAVLLAAEAAERDHRYRAACRAGLRSGLRRMLDSECRNWTQLMDFEVRALVDRVLAPCRAVAAPSP